VLFPHLAGIVVEQVDGVDGEVRLWVRSRQVDAAVARPVQSSRLVYNDGTAWWSARSRSVSRVTGSNGLYAAVMRTMHGRPRCVGVRLGREGAG
jgi:hypothetical protein